MPILCEFDNDKCDSSPIATYSSRKLCLHHWTQEHLKVVCGGKFAMPNPCVKKEHREALSKLAILLNSCERIM